uniref:Protein kinase-like domain, phloem protein 2-like protein n=1 Tax=Tanacetum cinerariifolium TaxID=118510 RepID=A0A6L2JKW1_TANCI|nr:protein kinase-like domain, phloem protein 2-like protein [Tanacetum cinerariifolium]
MRIQLKDIKLATNKFSPEYCIVSEGYSTVYKADFDHVDRKYCLAIEGENVREVPKKQSTVVVKRIFDTEDESGKQGFYAEIKMLTSCKHSNILTLLDFCDEDSEIILVYEQEIVHRDIKSANILLDGHLDAIIGDFGFCKFLYSENEEHNKHCSRQIAGTKVYMDP